MVIDTLIKNLEAVSFADVTEEAVDKTTEDLVRLQKLQLLSGKDADSRPLGRYKNKKYAAQKHLQNPLPGLGNMDFRLTGDFYRGIIVDARATGVVIDSADDKTEKLLDINGKAFGLNTESTAEYTSQYMAPAANSIIKSKIHK
jgi:hypothetical protein